MATTSKKLELSIAVLQLNPENPRLGPRDDGAAWTQANLLEYYADRADVKELAKDITLSGTNPSKRLIVEQAGRKSPKMYRVLEGNRRVAALRLLLEPALAGIPSGERTFRDLRKQAAAQLPDVFDVVVLTFEQAKHWLEIEHARGQGGKATVPWEPLEHSRFSGLVTGNSRHGRSIALLDLMQQRGLIDTAALKKVPLTTLDRIIGDPYVRRSLRWKKEHPPLEKSGQALHRIVLDLTEGMRVQKVFDKKLRKKYINEILANPDVSHSGRKNTGKIVFKRSTKARHNRKFIIPTSFVCKSAFERTKEIVRELKTLPVEGFENAVAITMRTLLELALKEYIQEHNLPVRETAYGYDMTKAVTACCDSMISRQTIERKALRPLRDNATQDYHFLSIKSFHGMVHDQYARPLKRELMRKWDECEPFFVGSIGVKR